MMPAHTTEPFSYRRDADVPAFADDHPIIVFDGKCVLCSGFVQFVLRHDRQATFRVIAAQSTLGTALYKHDGLDAADYETNLLLQDGHAYMKSSGTLRMFQMLDFPYSWLAMGRWMPRPIRDRLYDLIASRRLSWFGSSDTCMRPEARVTDRFLG